MDLGRWWGEGFREEWDELSARKTHGVRRKTHFDHAGSTSVVQPFVVVG